MDHRRVPKLAPAAGAKVFARLGFVHLFRVGDELIDAVRIINNREIKSPALVYPRLPPVVGFIVFLGVKGRMMKILLPGILSA